LFFMRVPQVQAAPLGQDPVAGQQTFQSLCVSCHTIGGGNLVGPDLAGVTERRDAAWLQRFIVEPDKVLAEGDPIATALLAEFNNVPMPNMGVSATQAGDILAYLAAPAEGAAAGPVAAAPSGKAPSLAGYAPSGERLFSGVTPLAAGGMPCIACHSVEGVGVLGGGSLGPDLTQVHTRYGGTGLAAALSTLPFPSMQSIYATRQLTPAEQADLQAFFARAAQQATPRPLEKLLVLLTGGAGLAGGLFLGMLFFWPRQRTSISQRLRQKGPHRQARR
jgi:cytochrome c2